MGINFPGTHSNSAALNLKPRFITILWTSLLLAKPSNLTRWRSFSCAPPPHPQRNDVSTYRCCIPRRTLVGQLSEPLPRGQQLTALPTLPRHQPSSDCCQQVALDARCDLFQMATVVRLVETNKDVSRYRYVDVLCRKLLNIDMDSAFNTSLQGPTKTNPVRSVLQYSYAPF